MENGLRPIAFAQLVGASGVPGARANVILAALTDGWTTSPWKEDGVAVDFH